MENSIFELADRLPADAQNKIRKDMQQFDTGRKLIEAQRHAKEDLIEGAFRRIHENLMQIEIDIKTIEIYSDKYIYHGILHDAMMEIRKLADSDATTR
jgi:hypothetical protein